MMVTRTERLRGDPVTIVAAIKMYEERGWAVRQLIMNEATYYPGGGAVVVLEREAIE